jgi:sulfite reductase (NADPH) flavoprotein alpha-component
VCAAPGLTAQPAIVSSENAATDADLPKYSRANPFPATLLTNRKLNAPGSEKDTRHVEIALDSPELSYSVGDALGIFPKNCPELVAEILAALKFSGDEAVPGRAGAQITIREALSGHYEITKISQPFLKAMADASRDDLLQKLTAPGVNGELTKFLWGREIIDLLLAHPTVKFAPTDFVKLLKKLPPRLYSISSSPKAHPGQVHLTVGVVRYASLARQRKGVCSTFLSERAGTTAPLPVFIQENKNFRPPPSGDTPMIMIGPGTGIAPFRAFLEERRATGARGKNWLFFGDQRAATDFIYRDELETLRHDGLLSRLDLAFSRDQAEKVYVQHRLRENARELFHWLEQGAHVYVCGDASRMAKDVNETLHELVQTTAAITREKAGEYIAQLKAENRYQRDVY